MIFIGHWPIAAADAKVASAKVVAKAVVFVESRLMMLICKYDKFVLLLSS